MGATPGSHIYIARNTAANLADHEKGRIFIKRIFGYIKAISARNVKILKKTDGKINKTSGTKRETPKRAATHLACYFT